MPTRVTRERWPVSAPFVDPRIFFSADTHRGELARKIVNELPVAAGRCRRRLRKTVERYNSFRRTRASMGIKEADACTDRQAAVLRRCHTPRLHDSYTGIRMNTNAQVLYLHGRPIRASTSEAIHPAAWPATAFAAPPPRPHRRHMR